jgi:hypothetical protein
VIAKSAGARSLLCHNLHKGISMNNAGIFGMGVCLGRVASRGPGSGPRTSPRTSSERRHVRRLGGRHILRFLAVLLTLGLVCGVMATAALAIPPSHDPSEPPEPPPHGGQPDFSPPSGGFSWRVDGRFGAPITNPDDGLAMRNFHYCAPERPNVNCRGDVSSNAYRYDPAYVHPTALNATFDGCPTEEEDDATGPTQHRYTWQIVDTSTSTVLQTFGPVATCNFTHAFAVDAVTGRGAPNTGVRLTITNPSAPSTPILDSPFEQSVVVRDYLIVSIGDSYASGEGNPDIPQVMAEDPIFHVPLPSVVREAHWEDQRCHRSALAGSAQAALQLERSDPHSSVTYISFACSGANVKNPAYKDVNPFDPYDIANNQTDKGSGILDRYAGIVMPDPADFSYGARLPNQIDQVKDAVGTRHIDAMVMSGGGNDIGFSNVATLCVMAADCKNRQVTANEITRPGVQKTSLDTRVKDDLATLDGIYDELATRLNTSGLDVGRFLVTEYPDTTRDLDGSPCSAILDDVIPWATVLGLDALVGLLAIVWPPLGLIGAALLIPELAAGFPNGVRGDEVSWAGDTVLPSGGANADHGLDRVIARSAAAHAHDQVPWELVGGITEDFQGTGSRSGNAGHGYCSSQKWIQTASDSAWTQGPFGFLTGMVANLGTDGTLHPNGLGHIDYAHHIFDHLRSLLPTPPAASAEFTMTDTNATGNTVADPDGTTTVTSTAGQNGWLIGCSPSGNDCPTGSPRVVSQIVAVVNPNTTVRGAGLSINGVTADCTTGSGLPDGVLCQSELLEYGRLQKWSFQFAHDGTYRLDASVTGHDDSVADVSRDVKVDLHDPLAPLASPGSPNANGWYNAPVTVTFDLPDPGNGGSALQGVGVQGVEYVLDGGAAVMVLAKSQLQAGIPLSQAQAVISGDGTHTLVFHTVDVGGRASADVTLQLKIDTTVPSATVSAPGAPVTYTLNQSVASSYSCTDALSGVAGCSGPVVSGQAIDTTSPGAKTFAVTATDKAGNVGSTSVGYTVGFGVCPQYDQTKAHKAGSTVPVKIQLCDVVRANVSAPAITVKKATLVKVDNSASSSLDASTTATADSDFRYDAGLGGYIYNLKTTGLTTGTWAFSFTASGDGTTHRVFFDIR